MRVAALYDIHGNLPALRAALEDATRHGVDRIVVGGDVFPGPLAEECLSFLLTRPEPTCFLRGNGENDLLALRRGETLQLPPTVLESMQWQAERVDDATVARLEGWPETIGIDLELGRVLFCHATPTSDRDLVTVRTPEEHFEKLLAGVDADVVVSGHTHMVFDRSVGARRWINAGSVGMPFGEAGAHWLLLDAAFEAQRTAYDAQQAALEIVSSSDPHAGSFAESSVLAVPSAEEMLELFGTPS